MVFEKLHEAIRNFNKAFNWRRFRRDALHLGESLLVFGVLYGIFSTVIWGVCWLTKINYDPDLIVLLRGQCRCCWTPWSTRHTTGTTKSGTGTDRTGRAWADLPAHHAVNLGRRQTARLPQGRGLTCWGQKEHSGAARRAGAVQLSDTAPLIWCSLVQVGTFHPRRLVRFRDVPPLTEHSHGTERTNNMGEDYKAKIEVLLNNEGHVDMCLNGDTTTLQNLAISVLAQTIALGMDSWEAAKKRLTDITVALPLALEEAWKDKETDNAAADKSAAADAAQNTMQEA